MKRDPEPVARLALLAALDYLDETSSCIFCELGHVPSDEPEPHDEGCPLAGFERTVDFNALHEWARTPHPSPEEKKT